MGWNGKWESIRTPQPEFTFTQTTQKFPVAPRTSTLPGGMWYKISITSNETRPRSPHSPQLRQRSLLCPDGSSPSPSKSKGTKGLSYDRSTSGGSRTCLSRSPRRVESFGLANVRVVFSAWVVEGSGALKRLGCATLAQPSLSSCFVFCFRSVIIVCRLQASRVWLTDTSLRRIENSSPCTHSNMTPEWSV